MLSRMISARKADFVSPEDYLAGELESSVKHEYVGGVLYSMAGANNVHNQIRVNTLAHLYTRLRGSSCRPYNSDTKVRLRFPTHERFYYPDVMVVCRPNAGTDSFQEQPTLIVEVISAKTRRADEGEKKDAYLSLSSLDVYLLIEQSSPCVVAYCRTSRGFVREIFEGLDAIVPLATLKTAFPLSEIYEGVESVPEAQDEA
jgi:Uma2 family endonuclease